MLPDFDAAGNLPPGIHRASWSDLNDRFGTTAHRRRLLGGLLRALRALTAAGCRRAYVDGSFVTAATRPRDFDAAWDTAGVDLRKLDPVLKTFANGRAMQKARYMGELFPATISADSAGKTFLEFFQIDRSGAPKGIVVLDLLDLPT